MAGSAPSKDASDVEEPKSELRENRINANSFASKPLAEDKNGPKTDYRATKKTVLPFEGKWIQRFSFYS